MISSFSVNINSVSLGGNKVIECADIIDVDEEEEEDEDEEEADEENEVVLETDCSIEFDVKKVQSNRPC